MQRTYHVENKTLIVLDEIAHSLHASAHVAALLFFLLGFHGFDVFGLEDLTAIETFHIVHAVSAGNNLGTGMLTSGLHRQRCR
jgi:hypothetical protein